jgi:hypothetical protein
MKDEEFGRNVGCFYRPGIAKGKTLGAGRAPQGRSWKGREEVLHIFVNRRE